MLAFASEVVADHVSVCTGEVGQVLALVGRATAHVIRAIVGNNRVI